MTIFLKHKQGFFWKFHQLLVKLILQGFLWKIIHFHRKFSRFFFSILTKNVSGNPPKIIWEIFARITSQIPIWLPSQIWKKKSYGFMQKWISGVTLAISPAIVFHNPVGISPAILEITHQENIHHDFLLKSYSQISLKEKRFVQKFLQTFILQ